MRWWLLGAAVLSTACGGFRDTEWDATRCEVSSVSYMSWSLYDGPTSWGVVEAGFDSCTAYSMKVDDYAAFHVSVLNSAPQTLQAPGWTWPAYLEPTSLEIDLDQTEVGVYSGDYAASGISISGVNDASEPWGTYGDFADHGDFESFEVDFFKGGFTLAMAADLYFPVAGQEDGYVMLYIHDLLVNAQDGE